MNFRERIGNNIRYYRNLNNLTMKDVAQRVGLTEATVQKYEAGKIKRVDVELIESIAAAVGTTAKQLTGYTDEQEEHEAHLERIAKRDARWFSKYRDLPYNKQKVVNDLIDALQKSDAQQSEDEGEIMRKLRYITDEARDRILNQLDYEYESERKKRSINSKSSKAG